MYSTLFYNINIVCKVLFLILMLFCVYFLNNIWILGLILLILNILFRNKKYLYLSMLLFILGIFFNLFKVFLKIDIAISYIYMFFKHININSVRYFFEVLFYKNQSNKFMYFLLSVCYFFKFYVNNCKNYFMLADSYGINKDFNYYRYTLSNSYKKTCSDIDCYMDIYKMRFYNIYNKRTYIDNYDISSSDIKVVLFGFIILFFVLVFGR